MILIKKPGLLNALWSYLKVQSFDEWEIRWHQVSDELKLSTAGKILQIIEFNLLENIWH